MPTHHATAAALDIVPATFTGSGREYFRIWLVHLVLTLATLGVYSAWAKARRLRYFDRNTMLAGATFDFCGRPGAILKGRALALLLLGGYAGALAVAPKLAPLAACALLAVLPWLMRSALRYRLRHTSYRGLRFGFRGSVAGAYRAWLPPLAAVLLPATLRAVAPHHPLSLAALLPLLGWPAMHAALLRYQFGHVTYGNRRARFEVPAWRLFAPWVDAALLFVAGVAAFACVAFGVSALYAAAGWGKPGAALAALGVAGNVLPFYLLLLLCGPYLQARLANVTWPGMSFPGMRVHCAMDTLAYIRLRHANAMLTVLTLGLYRPFAVVRVYRYRLACLALHAQDDFETMSAGARRVRPRVPVLDLAW